MRKVIILFLILCMGAVAAFLLMKQKKPQFNLSKAERYMLEVDGKEYAIALSKYDPPYFHTKLLAKREEADCSTPEGTVLALWSTVGGDRDWYLSLFDESNRKYMLKKDQETGGKILEEYNKGKPLPDPLKKGTYSKLMYKIDIKINGKEYAIIQEKRVHDGKEEFYPSYMVFAKEGDIWKRSFDLSEHSVTDLTQKNYEEVKEILKKGSWSAE